MPTSGLNGAGVGINGLLTRSDLLGPIIRNAAQVIGAWARQESGEQQEAYPDVYRRIGDVLVADHGSDPC